eukprot:498621-Rhodomonas_salina.5
MAAEALLCVRACESERGRERARQSDRGDDRDCERKLPEIRRVWREEKADEEGGREMEEEQGR